MKLFVPASRFSGAAWRLLAAALAAAVLAPGSATAAIWDPFSGYVDLTAVQSEVSGLEENTFRQEYNGTFSHRFLPLLETRASLRYYKFDQELDAALGSYREEIQPSAEVRWSHPEVLAVVSGRQRRVRPPFSTGAIITDGFQASLKSQNPDFPLWSLRFDDTRTHSEEDFAAEDVHSRRAQASVDYVRGDHFFNYGYSRLSNDNVITGLGGTANQHLLRWNGTGREMADGRLRWTGSYVLNYGIQSTDVPAGEPVWDLVPLSAGLYAWDDAPEFGALENRSSIADGNTLNAALPLIDIGGGGGDHNLGADLGGARPLGAIYVYTDRPSAPGVRWTVYVSNDNLTWTSWSAAPSQFFNLLLNRYEIGFPTVTTRYIKVVSSGLNEIAQVYVTEIEVLQELVRTTDSDRIRSSHQADIHTDYRINDRWRATMDVSLGVNRTHSQPDARHRFSYSGQLRHTPSERRSHLLRWEQSWQRFEDSREDVRDDIATATMMFTPLPTLRGSVSLTDRMTWVAGDLGRNLAGGAAEASAELLPDLDLTLGVGLSDYRDFGTDSEYFTVTCNAGAEAALTSRLDILGNVRAQRTHDGGDDKVIKRESADLGTDLRLTDNIYFRGSVRFQSETSDVVIQDYLLSWNMTPGCRISAQSYGNRSNGQMRNERHSVNVNVKLGVRSTLYVRVAEVDLSGSGGVRTASFQQGFRTSF